MSSSKNKNIKWIYTAAIGVILVSITVYFYERYRDQKTDTARNALYEARKLFPAQPEAGGAVDPDQVYAEGVKKLDEIAKSAPSDTVRFEAALELGSLFTANGRGERGLSFLVQAEKLADSEFKRAAVAWLKANAYAHQKMWTESEAEYVKVSKSKELGMKGRALVALIELSRTTGKLDGAKAYYEVLKRDFVQDNALIAEGEKALESAGASL